MRVYDYILQGWEATEQNAFDAALGLDWGSIETTEGNRTRYSDHIDTINGIEIYYDYGADYYYFVDNTNQGEHNVSKQSTN